MDTGTKVYRNYFPLKFGWQCDCQFGRAYPVFRKMMYAGDVFKVHADLLIRYQPMMAPPMNDCTATVRFFFVPLRLVEKQIELIITGSNDGHLSEETLPVCESIFKNLVINTQPVIKKYSMMDLLYQIPVGATLTSALITKLENSKASPAAYFAKAYYRAWWDYYRDENLFQSYTDFDSFLANYLKYQHDTTAMPAMIKKDRFSSSMPWQLKNAVAPAVEIIGSGTMNPNYNFELIKSGSTQTTAPQITLDEGATSPFHSAASAEYLANANEAFMDQLNTSQPVNMTVAGFTAEKVRDVLALTRIYERGARTGTRYTEYLRANFGVAPSDGTLQRAQYLGGFKTKIVTTEVIQTAGAVNSSSEQTPVGTLRGHGITHGTSTIRPFMAKEPGVMIGIMDVLPETIYANGVDRELCARSRFDFLNPSFQHLSEQEVRKGEIYFDIDTDTSGNLKNDETWGFQPYAEELRRGIKHVCGDMRDGLSYWNQALTLSSRPSLNYSFISGTTHRASYNKPFVYQDASTAYPMVVDFGGLIESYRPIVKNGTPGLADHN